MYDYVGTVKRSELPPQDTDSQNINRLDGIDVLVLSVGVHLEHLVDEWVLTQGAQVELLKALLVLQPCQGLAQLVQSAHGRYGIHGLGANTHDTQQTNGQITVMMAAAAIRSS